MTYFNELFASRCLELVKYDIAILSVEMESEHYMVSMQDLRLTLMDKVASFGKYFNFAPFKVSLSNS